MAEVLLVDDDQRFLDATVQLLSLLGHKVMAADSVKKARELLGKNHYSHVILDLILPDGVALQSLLQRVPLNGLTPLQPPCD